MNTNIRSLAYAVKPSSRHRVGHNYAQQLKDIWRRKLTWLVLIAYTLMLFKPAMPVFADMVAHAFYEQQHMLTVHEVNGVFHVHNEVVKNDHGTERNKQATNTKVESIEGLTVDKHIVTNSVAPICIKMLIFSLYTCFYCSSIPDVETPPPNAGQHQ